jgi:glyoxylase-like metal-dependent hydrolase (beta-lactamase superfamily II)
MWFTIKKINKFVWGIGEFNHFEKVISYLILGKNKALLFDTGLGIKNIKKEVFKITKLPVVVVNSHDHFDHLGGNKFFNEILNTDFLRFIHINPFEFEVVKTPGHSPDSICLYEKKKKWLFSGDTLYPGPIYLHLKESNLPEYVKSLRKLMKYKITKIFSAHNDFLFPKKNINKIYDLISNKKNLKKKEIIDKETSLLIE